jgi:hypothetical protein
MAHRKLKAELPAVQPTTPSYNSSLLRRVRNFRLQFIALPLERDSVIQGTVTLTGRLQPVLSVALLLVKVTVPFYGWLVVVSEVYLAGR